MGEQVLNLKHPNHDQAGSQQAGYWERQGPINLELEV